MPEVGPEHELLSWGLPRLRDLPWRHTRDPWAVLVAEVMLQQTQTRRVIPKWSAFIEAFPTFPDCAAAPLGEVLRLWQGLGYPRRARDLHAAAVMIDTDLEGRFPDTLDGLRALPGVGPYTARAVLAFAFESDAAVVDTNVARVLARVAGGRLTARRGAGAGRRLVAGGRGVGVEPGDARPRRGGLHASRTGLRRLPDRGPMRVAGRRCRPGRGVGRGQRHPVPVRGFRPPGPRADHARAHRGRGGLVGRAGRGVAGGRPRACLATGRRLGGRWSGRAHGRRNVPTALTAPGPALAPSTVARTDRGVRRVGG